MKWEIVLLVLGLGSANYCWRAGYHREIVKDIKYCPEGYEKDRSTGDDICHEICADGWRHGDGIHEDHCYKDCPEGFDTTGFDYCLLGHYYARTEYYIYSHCLDDNPQGCQAIGISWYPLCKENYYPEGAYCMPKCPDDMPLYMKKWCTIPSFLRSKMKALEDCNL